MCSHSLSLLTLDQFVSRSLCGEELNNLETVTRVLGYEPYFVQRQLCSNPKIEEALWRLEQFAALDINSGRFVCHTHKHQTRWYPGTFVGTLTPLNYRQITLTTRWNKRAYLEHILIWAWITGDSPTEIDHINGDRSDNRPSNLRDAGRVLNGRNRVMSSNNVSGYTGVWQRQNGKWETHILHKHIGTFHTPEEAYQARLDYIAAHPELGFTERHGK